MKHIYEILIMDYSRRNLLTICKVSTDSNIENKTKTISQFYST
jgi:hypothetical protein